MAVADGCSQQPSPQTSQWTQPFVSCVLLCDQHFDRSPLVAVLAQNVGQLAIWPGMKPGLYREPSKKLQSVSRTASEISLAHTFHNQPSLAHHTPLSLH